MVKPQDIHQLHNTLKNLGEDHPDNSPDSSFEWYLRNLFEKKTSEYIKELVNSRELCNDGEIATNNTALHLVCQSKYIKKFNNESEESIIVNQLLNVGSDINSVNADGITPLIILTYLKKIGLVTKLIEKGANLNYQNPQGYSALMIAKYYGYEDLVSLFINKGADIALLSGSGETIPYNAEEKNYEDIGKLVTKSLEEKYLSDDGKAPKTSPKTTETEVEKLQRLFEESIGMRAPQMRE